MGHPKPPLPPGTYSSADMTLPSTWNWWSHSTITPGQEEFKPAKPRRFLATADWHIPPVLRATGWGGLAETADDVWVALDDVFTVAEAENCDAVLIGGDIFDGPRVTVEMLGFLFERCSSIGAARVLKNKPGCYYVLGNHDGGEDWLSFCYGVTTPTEHPAAEGVVFGRSYAPDFDPVSCRIPGNTCVHPVGLYHQPFVEFGGRGPWKAADLPAHKLAVCGDTHTVGLIECAHAGGPRWALSPGPLVPQCVGEERTGYGLAWVWDAATPDTPPQSVLLPRRRLYVTVALTPGAEDAALARAAKLAADEHAAGHPPPAVLFEAAVFPTGFRAAAIRAAERAGYPAGCRVRPLGDTRVSPPDRAAARAAARAGLAAAVSSWPGLDDADRPLAARLADPSGDPRTVLNDARPPEAA